LRRRRSIRYPQGAGETVIGLAPIEIARPFFSCFLGFCLCYFKLFQRAKISLLSPAAKPHLTTYLCIPRDSGETGTTLIPLLSSDSTEKTWLPLRNLRTLAHSRAFLVLFTHWVPSGQTKSALDNSGSPKSYQNSELSHFSQHHGCRLSPPRPLRSPCGLTEALDAR
jgi:hypothetical protein